jgi:putative methanogenesis marker protein 17
MEIEVISEDKEGKESYEKLFGEIMADIGKAFQIEKATLVLKPSVPLFIFSIKLRAEPSSKKVSDVANVRSENNDIYMTITDERFAPEILSQLWKKYGRDDVAQQTRFDIEVKNANEKDIVDIPVASGEEAMKEIIGAVWRSMPEGIKNRHTYVGGTVITVVATEETFEPFMLEEGLSCHNKMRGSKDV